MAWRSRDVSADVPSVSYCIREFEFLNARRWIIKKKKKKKKACKYVGDGMLMKMICVYIYMYIFLFHSITRQSCFSRAISSSIFRWPKRFQRVLPFFFFFFSFWNINKWINGWSCPVSSLMLDAPGAQGRSISTVRRGMRVRPDASCRRGGRRCRSRGRRNANRRCRWLGLPIIGKVNEQHGGLAREDLSSIVGSVLSMSGTGGQWSGASRRLQVDQH